MIFAVTMKITRSTSMTSTSGVTLMPLISPSSSSEAPPAMLLAPGARFFGLAGEVREKHSAQRVRVPENRPDLAAEVVVRRDRGDCDGETDGRRDERFGD